MQRLRYFLWGDGKDVRFDDISASSRGVIVHVAVFACMRACAYVVSTVQSGSAQGDWGAAPDAGQREAPILTFKDTRMLAFGVDNSAKLSAYLAAGCISPRMVYAELRKAAAVQGPQQCAWLEMHLTIRCVKWQHCCSYAVCSESHGAWLYRRNAAPVLNSSASPTMNRNLVIMDFVARAGSSLCSRR